MTRRAARAATLLALGVLAGAGITSRGGAGSLPPAYGGLLRVPAPGTAATLDPTRPRGTFDAVLTHAVYDGLYRLDGTGVRTALAAQPPARSGDVVTIALRPGIARHDGRTLEAADVVASLRRAAESPSGWLLAGIATRADRSLDVRAVDRERVELRMVKGADVDVARVLAAAPLAIVAGDPGRRPVGTGAFAVKVGAPELRLRAFARAAEGCPYLDEVRVAPPRSRQEDVRAFELGQLDASWFGASLYGGQPVRPVASTELPPSTPVLLVPNRAGALRDAGTWGAIARAIDPGRVERVGLVRAAALDRGLPPPPLPQAGAIPAGLTLRLLVREGDDFERRLADAIGGMLDERRVTAQIVPAADDRYESAVTGGGWDLRIAQIVAPLPDPGALVAAALATTGRTAEARTLAASRALFDPRAAAAAAARIDAVVLGRRREVLHHRADLRGIAFDGLGRLSLADLSLERGPDGDVR